MLKTIENYLHANSCDNQLKNKIIVTSEMGNTPIHLSSRLK